MRRWLYAFYAVLFFAAGCSSRQSTSSLPDSLKTDNAPQATVISTLRPTTAPETINPSPTAGLTPTPDLTRASDTPTSVPSPSPLPTLDPENWQEWPIVPQVNPEVTKIFRRGMELGNDPNAFSKIGDCGSTPAWFLGDFDRDEDFYSLGDYKELAEVIDQFHGSYSRTSLAAKSGFNASSVFASIWSNRSFCEPDETPLTCEFRVHKPSYALVMLGSNDVYHLDTFEAQMRKIIEFSIENGVIPILSTKADNLEGDFSVNATLAKLAGEYGVPLLNYWAAVQPLPNQGLQEDGVHITWARNFFDDPASMKSGWTVRNLIALQALDAVWRAAVKNP